MDRQVYEWLLRNDGFNGQLARLVTDLGLWIVVTVIATALVVWRSRGRQLTIRLAFTLIGLVALRVGVATLKSTIGRQRPPADVAVIDADSAAMPSGHSANAAFLAVLLFAMLPGRWRYLGAVPLVIVPWSRIATGVHWPTDVLAGVAIGAAVAAGCVAAANSRSAA